MAEGYLGRRVACAHCPVACVHLAALRQCYEKDPYFFKTSMISYDHEPIFACGSLAPMPATVNISALTPQSAYRSVVMDALYTAAREHAWVKVD